MQQEAKHLNNPWIIYGAKQVVMFEKDPAAFTELLVTAKGLRQSMVMVYLTMVKYRLTKKIEDLPPREKERLWNFSKKLANERLSKEEGIELAKVLYILE